MSENMGGNPHVSTKAATSMDIYLAALGLSRKPITRDASCIFRAVAEKFYLTQAEHVRVKKRFIRYLKTHHADFMRFSEFGFSLERKLAALEDPEDWTIQLEMYGLSQIYRFDFVVFQVPNSPPMKVTYNGFDDRLCLCSMDGMHYDLVYTRLGLQHFGIVQSIVYEILYKRVFGLTEELDEAVTFIRHQKKGTKFFGLENSFDNACSGTDLVTSPQTLPCADGLRAVAYAAQRNGPLKKALERPSPPLPYRIAKALDPSIYRNVEYDIVQEEIREAKLSAQLARLSTRNFSPGDKCQVVLGNEGDRTFSAYIQQLSDNEGPVVVFVEELGEKRAVPFKSLRPISQANGPGDKKHRKKRGSSMPVAAPLAQHQLKTKQQYQPPQPAPYLPLQHSQPPPFQPNNFLPINNSCPAYCPSPKLPVGAADPVESMDGGAGQYLPLHHSPSPALTPLGLPSPHPTPLVQTPVYWMPTVNVPYASSIGQVNMACPPSQDPFGKDLPLQDVNTMRFFFNVGVEQYCRTVGSLQQPPPGGVPTPMYQPGLMLPSEECPMEPPLQPPYMDLGYAQHYGSGPPPPPPPHQGQVIYVVNNSYQPQGVCPGYPPMSSYQPPFPVAVPCSSATQ